MMFRKSIKKIDTKISNIIMGNSVGLYCHIVGNNGGNKLKNSKGVLSGILASDGFAITDCPVDLVMIDRMKSILDKIDSTENYEKLNNENIEVVKKKETTRLIINNIPKCNIKEIIDASEMALEKSKKLLGLKFEIIGATLYRNRSVTNLRDISADWHYDRRPTDWLRYFIYLTDVDQKCGPLHVIRLDDSVLLTKKLNFDRENIHHQEQIEKSNKNIILIGKAGTSVIANTQKILHRAGIPEANSYRDMFELIFKPA